MVKKQNKKKIVDRITILIDEEKKGEWQKFVKKYNYSSISNLIREAVDFLIELRLKTPTMKTLSRITYDLKEPLTSIKGFSQLILENYKDELSLDLILKIKDIFDQSIVLENRIKAYSKDFMGETAQYDILIVDDDNSTIKVLTNFFEIKGYSFKAVTHGNEVLEELENVMPKIILLDIILPDKDGYEICKTIKSNSRFKDIKVFYITAIPEDRVEEKIGETEADGYFFKPFDFLEFEKLFNYL